MAIKRCKASFAASVNGAPHMFKVGQLVDEKDPVVKGREHLFEDVETHVSENRSRVEQATAEPGEKRSLGRPAAKKTAAPVKKTAAKPEVKHEPKDDSSKEGTS